MSKLDSKTTIYNVARQYYIDNYSQSEIAKMIGISRPQVSRLLKRAKELGIVDIKITPPFASFEDMSEKLSEKLGVENVYIVENENPDEQGDAGAIQAIAAGASSILPDLIAESKFTGIGWGKTVYETVLAMDFNQEPSDTCFIPLIGNLGMAQPHYQVNSMVDRIAEKFKAKGMFMNLPAYMQDINTKELARNNGQFFELMDTWKKLDLAIIGLGVGINDSEFLKHQLDKKIVDELKEQNVVGDILSQFFHEDGTLCRTDLQLELTALDVEKLSSVKNVVCLCGGRKKAKGILAAAKKGYFNILITDSVTGAQILSEQEGDL